MPVNTQAVIDRRREEVEQAMLSLEWSLHTQNTLASRHGVTVRQIRQDAQKIREGWAEDEKELEPDARADWLSRCRSGQAMAIRGDYPMAFVHLLRLEAQCRGLLAPTTSTVEVIHSVANQDPVEQARQIVQAYPEAKRYLETANNAITIVED
jgi:hypothetical protein